MLKWRWGWGNVDLTSSYYICWSVKINLQFNCCFKPFYKIEIILQINSKWGETNDKVRGGYFADRDPVYTPYQEKLFSVLAVLVFVRPCQFNTKKAQKTQNAFSLDIKLRLSRKYLMIEKQCCIQTNLRKLILILIRPSCQISI